MFELRRRERRCGPGKFILRASEHGMTRIGSSMAWKQWRECMRSCKEKKMEEENKELLPRT